MRTLKLSFSGLLLALAVACGGSSSGANGSQQQASPAHGLAYTNPTGTGWRLVKDATSTSTRLVLNLVGPAGTNSRGVGFNLQVPAKVHIGEFGTPGGPFGKGIPVEDTGVYELLNSFGTYDLEPGLLAGGVKPGNVLTVGIFQKDRIFAAKPSNQPLLRIALDFDATAGLHAGDALPLTVLKAKYMAEDIGPITYSPSPDEYSAMSAKAKLQPISLAVGALTAN